MLRRDASLSTTDADVVVCHKALDAAEETARSCVDEAEQQRIRLAIANVSGLLFTEVILGIIRVYPDLDPYPRDRADRSESFDRRLMVVSPGPSGVVDAFRQDGSVVRFTQSGATWTPDADVNDRLNKLAISQLGMPVAWELSVAADESIERYSSSGMLLSVTHRAGKVILLTYGGANGAKYPSDAPTCVRPAGIPSAPIASLGCVTDTFGNQLVFAYDGNDRLSTLVDPSGAQTSYFYDASGRLASVAAPDGTVRVYHYNEAAHTASANLPFALTGITDESNVRFATFKYNSSGHAISSEHAGGVGKIEATYSTNASSVSDAGGGLRSYGFTTILGMPRPQSASQPCSSGCTSVGSSMTYDSNANVTSRTDFEGNKTCYAYDSSRNLETERVEGFAPGSVCPSNLSAYTPGVGTRERKISTTWHSTYRLPTQITEAGRSTVYQYDSSGNVLTRTVTDLANSPTVSRAWTYTYNNVGNVLTVNGPRTDASDVTIYTYYSCTTGYQCGQVETITNALGHVTTYNTYNAHGQPLTITDPNGVVTTLTYDLRQRLKSRTVGTEQTTLSYWPTGLLKRTTLPDGSYLEYTYDAARRLTDVTDSEGNRIHYTLDVMGNRTKEEAFDPSGAPTVAKTQVFNKLNQLWKEIGAAGGASVTTTYGYDDNGNQTSISAPLGRNTAQTYDELDRLTTITDAENGLTSYGYDAFDRLSSVTDPKGLTTSYEYNALGDLEQLVSPDTGATNNTYDSGGNLKTSTDARNKTSTYEYDALNRVTSVTYVDQVIGFAYDTGTNQKGRLTQLTDNSGSTNWTYDAQGRMTSRQQIVGAISKSIEYSYDTSGRLETLTLPSGSMITYAYANGRVSSVTLNSSTTLLSNVLYHPLGPTLGWEWGNGTYTVREYDADGRITLIDSAGIANYSYHPDGTIASVTQEATKSEWGSAGTTTFDVSSASNRLVSSTGQLSRTYTYDDAGNVTGDGSRTFAYDDRGRMVSVTADGLVTTYSYNALGQRVRKVRGTTTTYFVYDEIGRLVGEYDSSGDLIQELVWLDDTPIATLRHTQGGAIGLFYIHTDHLNTPVRVTRPEDNSLIWRWDRDPFGNGAPDTDPDGNLAQLVLNLRFPGQYFDSESSLHYNYFRDYDPQTGRYVQSDP